MENIQLRAGEHCKVYEHNGKKFVAIELNDWNVYTSESGNTYVSLTAIEVKESKHGETHFVKVGGHWDKEKECVVGIDAIIGNIRPIEKKAPTPQVQQVDDKEASDGDLPF